MKRPGTRTGGAVSRVVWGLAAVAWAAHPWVPAGPVATWWYVGAAVLAVFAGFLGLRGASPDTVRAWVMVLGGFTGWVVGDLVWAVETDLLGLDRYPLVSDAFYLGSYGLLAAGAMKLLRLRQDRPDRHALLDAAIVAVGCGVLAGVFLIEPIARDSGLSLLGKLVSSAYPLADVVLIAVVMRMWTAPVARTAAYRLLLSALASTLLADALWNEYVLRTGDSGSTVVHEMLWLASYLLVAAAAIVAGSHGPGRVPEASEPVPRNRRRLFVLAAGLTLPGFTLLLRLEENDSATLVVIGLGSLLLTVLILARMSSLLSAVEQQAVQLSALARADHLTGVANRRTWDHELSRACRASAETGSPLWVALLDLDHFKAFNDTFGHQAGDQLLRESVAAWSERLEKDAFLARYGGEEFAILLPGRTEQQAVAILADLRAATPSGQSFSAGVALWRAGTAPAVGVAEADAALYRAKAAGRRRTVVASPPAEDALSPRTAAPRLAEHDGSPAGSR